MIKQIFHIADLHIHERNYSHISHAWSKLIIAITSVPEYETEVILVIAGDVFDHKTWLTAGDVSLFYRIMSDIETKRIRTIMMPGNHDYNINSSNGDKLLALVERSNYKFVTYTSTSDIIVIENVAFFVHSPVDGKTPRPTEEHKGLTSIAMVHEPLTNSKTSSGITFCQQRFSAEDFAVTFDMTMLGDIHMPQILAHNVAYSGSFVQKNRGEGIEHGYILWDVATRVPKFIQIDQLSVHLRVWARDNAADELPHVKARSISLNHVSCTDDWIATFQKRIEETYQCKIVGVFNKNTVESDDETKATVERPTRQELNTIIAKRLVELKVSEEQMGRVINLHHSTFEATPHEVSTDWRIRFLSWDNVYCYGEKNHINFDNIENLTSIVGPNKTGKSSVIDIIILVLFNESIRGAKKYALNISSSRGFIKCVVSVNNDTYEIERAWIDTKTVAVRVYKNGDNVSGTDLLETYKYLGNIIGSKRVFVNSTAALQHRQFLVDIGPKDRYELVCRMMELDRLRVAEDDNKSELRAKKKDKDKLEKKIEGSSDMEETLKNNQKEMTNVKALLVKIDARLDAIRARESIVSDDIIKDSDKSAAEISTLIHELRDFETFTEQIALESCVATELKCTTSLDDMERDLKHLNKRYMQHKTSLVKCDTLISLDSILEKVAIAEKTDIGPIVARLSDIKVQQCKLTASITTSESTMKSLRNDIREKQKRIDGRARPLHVVKKDNDNAQEHRDVSSLHMQAITLTAKNAELSIELSAFVYNATSKQRRFLLTIEDDLTVEETKHALSTSDEDHNKNLEELTEQIDACQAQARVNNARYITCQKSISVKRHMLTQRKAKINASVGMKWSHGCVSCDSNKSLCGDMSLSSELEAKEHDIMEEIKSQNLLEEEIKLSDIHIPQIKEKLNRCITRHLYKRESQRRTHEALIANNDASYDKIQAEISAIEKSNNARQLLEDELTAATINASLQTEIKALEISIAKSALCVKENKCSIVELSALYETVEKPMILVQSAQKLREQHAVLLSNDIIRKKMNTLGSEISTLVTKTATEQKNVSVATKQIARLRQWKENASKLQHYKSIFNEVQASEDAIEEMDELNRDSCKLHVRQKAAVETMTTLASAIGRLEISVALFQEATVEIAILNQDILDMKVYDKAINHKTGVPKQLMINTCSQIEMRCNEILCQISDFTIGVVFDKEIQINTIHGEKVVSAEQSSGYQKFIIDLIMRQVLCSLTLAAHPRILFVDEGFGSLDKENFDIVCKKVLPGLANQFEKVIIISHINGIHEHTSANCVIKRNAGKSQLQFGPMIANGNVLRVIDDHMTSVNASNEERKIRKIDAHNKKSVERAEKKAAKTRNDKDAEEKAQQKQDEYGEAIIEDIDDKTVQCIACKKTYKKRYGFAAKHIKSKSHMKSMITFET
jgi:exonuclease SbcC